MKKFIQISLFISLLIGPFTGMSCMPDTASAINDTQQKTIVYVTRTGAKYHRGTCGYLKQSKIKLTKKEALANGYAACKMCKP